MILTPFSPFQMYPNMYRTAAGQDGASTSGSSGWNAGQYAEQMRQQQMLMVQMAAAQQQQQQQHQTQVNFVQSC